MIDIHSHILHGVDDGCGTFGESINQIKECINVGITDLCLTPHFSFRRNFATSYIEIENRFKLLKKFVSENNLNINLHLGSEIDEHSAIFDYLDYYLCHTMNDTKYVLLDFGTRKADVDSVCYELVLKGYKPIIAHPERYFYFDGLDTIKQWKKTGALIQMNASSLYLDKTIKKRSKLMLENNVVDIICSDTHKGVKTLEYFRKAFNYVKKKYGEEQSTRLFVTNPKKIIDNKHI